MSTTTRALRLTKDVHFFTIEDAEKVLSSMKKCIGLYSEVTLGDFYRFAELVPVDHVDAVSSESIGWLNLDGAEVYQDGSDWHIDFPTPRILGPRSMNRAVEPETVDHPNHYQSETGLEAIDVIEAFTFDLKGIEAFCTGNALKYLCRWKGKNGKTDLKKARWYINRLIDHIEKLEKENE